MDLAAKHAPHAVVAAHARTPARGKMLLWGHHSVMTILLQMLSETAHPDFRCFISAEPPPLSYLVNMPESLMQVRLACATKLFRDASIVDLLQSCIKVANEAPADLLSNFTRAWANFSQERIEACSKPVEVNLFACLNVVCCTSCHICSSRRASSHYASTMPSSLAVVALASR